MEVKESFSNDKINEDLTEILQSTETTMHPLLLSDHHNQQKIFQGTTIHEMLSGSQNVKENYRRTVKKDGNFNWSGKKVSKRHFFEDIFTTLVEIQWRILLLVFCIVYFGTWLIFTVIWWGLLYFHGDFEPHNFGNSSWNPCISDIKDFTGAFLFSVETQHTTGYGFYHLTENCAGTIITFCLQSIVGCILEGVMVGLLFVKITRGKKRKATLLFTKNSVITKNRENGLSFMFRVADLRDRSNLLEARIRAQLITRVRENNARNASGDLRYKNYFLRREELKVSAQGTEGTDFLLFWPTVIQHEINKESPLFKFISTKSLEDYHPEFEIVVVLEGIVEATGQMTQARSSYLSSEVYVNHTFKPMTITESRNGSLEIDFRDFHEIVPDDNLSFKNGIQNL